MIAAIRKGGYIKGAVEYNERKVKKGVAEFIGSSAMFYTSEQRRGGEFIQQLTNIADLNKNVTRPVFHVSLNSPPGQVLSNEQWLAVATDYMKAMGFGSTPHAVYRHQDRGHDHIHIVSVMVDGNGKRISDSNDRRRSQEALQAISEKHGLLQVPREKEGKGTKEDLKGSDLGLKSQVALKLENVLRFVQSIEQFKSELEKERISFQIKKGNSNKIQGDNIKNGIVFYAIDDKGRQASPGFKGSSFLQDFTLDTILTSLERNARRGIQAAPANNHHKERTAPEGNKIQRESVRENLYIKIKTALLQPGSLQDFSARLDAQGVKVKTSENAAGIYGISFEDKGTGEVYKASEVHRDLSWNKLKGFFQETPELSDALTLDTQNKVPEIKGNRELDQEGKETQTTKEEEKETGYAEHFSIPYSGTVMNTGADNMDEEEERRRKKRKGRFR